MRQKLRKYLKEFEEDLVRFRENPDQPDDDEEEEKRKFVVYQSIVSKLIFVVV